MTWSFALLIERTFQQSKSLRASAETTVSGRTARPWFHGSLSIAPFGTWPSSTHSRHHMSHRVLCRPEAQRQLRRTGRPPSTATCHPATCSSLWLSRLLAHWLMMDRFIREIGRRAALCTADPRETTFLYQRFTIAIQRFNSICLANSFSISESSG